MAISLLSNDLQISSNYMHGSLIFFVDPAVKKLLIIDDQSTWNDSNYLQYFLIQFFIHLLSGNI